MRNNDLWDTPMDQMPVYGTIASQFNDPGMNSLYKVIMDTLPQACSAKTTMKVYMFCKSADFQKV